MITDIVRKPAEFQPRIIMLTVESQEELDALLRAARTTLAKEHTAAGINRTTIGGSAEVIGLQCRGYGTKVGINTVSAFLRVVLAAR